MPKDPHEKKRKKKLAEKKRLALKTQSLAYLGAKYQKDKFVPFWLRTEIAIYETYVLTGRKLLDQTVAKAIERLIRQMRAKTLPPLQETSQISYDAGQEEELVIALIRRSWEKPFDIKSRPANEDVIGVLRSILGSIQKVKAPGPSSQSYMMHIAGFLTKQAGVSVQVFSEDQLPLPEPEADELVRLGRQWHQDGNQEARAEFFSLATRLLSAGEAIRVIDACLLLTGEISDPDSEIVSELFALNQQAREWLKQAMA